MSTSQRIFITGGGAGLGKAMAGAFAKRGNKVCIADIDDVSGQAVADELLGQGADVSFLHCDVCSEIDFGTAVEWLQKNWGGVDLVINNAGVAQMGPVEKTKLEDWQWIIDINLLSIVRSTQAFLPVFREQGKGHFINIASMAGLIHMPDASSYNATKSAVIALSETLMLELEKDNVTVQVVCPAFFRTDLAKNMRATDENAARVTKRLVERARIGAVEIAELVVKGSGDASAFIFTHPPAKQAWMFKRFLPFKRFQNMLRKQLKTLDERLARSESKSS